MKKVLLLIFVIALPVMIFTFSGCKKGENDPFMSLHSRKARLVGEWKLADGNIQSVSNGTSTLEVYNGNTCTLTDSDTTVTYPFTEELTFNSDGTYERVVMNDGAVETVEGYWTFGRKSKEGELKNKETVILRTLSRVYTSGGSTSTYQYEGTQCPVAVYKLDELRNKKMTRIFEGTQSGSWAFSQTGYKTYEQ